MAEITYFVVFNSLFITPPRFHGKREVDDQTAQRECKNRANAKNTTISPPATVPG
jgi:hypothetical protein